ncbi:16S rRNA (cytidine(1402)-2'-O)-methyltransferase [Persephonella sp.]
MGTLYIVATPIGNLKDITYRAVEILKNVDIIACEDTRVTRKLLTHYGITGKKLFSYHEHIEEKASDKIISLLKEGMDIALVSDAGTPCISDPGYRVVKKAWENSINVVPIPGPFAGAAALSASGLPSDRFIFVGFLPQKEKKKKEEIERLKQIGFTFILYESPVRVLKTLKIIEEIIPDSEVVVGKEITKIHERFIRGNIKDVYQYLDQNKDIIKGEFVIICNPVQSKEFNEDYIIETAEELYKKGKRIKEISKIISEETGFPKNRIYNLLLKKFNT